MIHAYQKPLCGKQIGIVFGSFSPLHQGHLDLIMRAKKECDAGCLVIVCGRDGDKGEPLMPHHKRYRYVREFFADDDLVAVYAINDTEHGLPVYPHGLEGWMKEFETIYKLAVQVNNETAAGRSALPERVWYVGEEDYRDTWEALGEHVVLVDRIVTNPISATMIRQNPLKNWDKIAPPFRRVFSHNILICGTASEGKTVMTEDLGKYFNAPYSHEWARDYMEGNCVAEWELDSVDYMALLNGQYHLNKKKINSPGNNGIFFADSDSMVTRMYAEFYAKDKTCALTQEGFEKVAVLADEITRKCRWDKVFVLAPHGVFVDDHVRYMAHSGMEERQEMFRILCDNLKNSGNWDNVTILTGNYYENFMDIVRYVRDLAAR